MTNKEVIEYLYLAVDSISRGRVHFARGASDREKHQREGLEARNAIERLKSVIAASDDFPQGCFLCGDEMKSKNDRDWHGLGNCIEICSHCGGSGEESSNQPRFYRCLDCGFSGEITTADIAKHRNTGCRGTTEGVR